jgi:hypothetical protein
MKLTVGLTNQIHILIPADEVPSALGAVDAVALAKAEQTGGI